MFYLYVLLNKIKSRTYVGVSYDVDKRLKEHNSERVESSRPYGPYEVIYTEMYETLKEARSRERYYKTTTGRRKLKELLKI